MKRIVLWISLLICILSLGAVSNSVSATPDTITITAEVPYNWTDVHLYVWDDSFFSLAEWPGTPMKTTDDGRYTLEIPVGYPNIIINNGGSSYQTQDMNFDGFSDIWVVVDGNYGEVLYYDPGSNVLNPPKLVESMSMLGEGNEGLSWSLDDANNEMRLVQDGYYYKELTLRANDFIKFRFVSNQSWDSYYNLGFPYADTLLSPGEPYALSNGSSDIIYSATQDCTLTVMLNLKGSIPILQLHEEPLDLPDISYNKIYVHVDGNFIPNLWAWSNSGDAFPSWPGEAMTKAGDWWVIEIPADCHSVIVNDGQSQTDDLTITPGEDNWVVVSKNWDAAVYTTQPHIPDPHTPVHVYAPTWITPNLWFDGDTSIMSKDGNWWTLSIPTDTVYMRVVDSVTGKDSELISLNELPELWIVVDKDLNVVTYKYEPVVVLSYPIYVQVPEGWSTPKCYYSTTALSKQPLELTLSGQWYQAKLPTVTESFYFTDGTLNSELLDHTPTKPLWIQVAEDGSVQIFDSEPPAQPVEEEPAIQQPIKIKRKPKADTDKNSSQLWLIVPVAAVAVLSIGTVVVILILKHKKKPVVSGGTPPTNIFQ